MACAFPQGVKLLSYLYNEAQNNCSNENYPVLLSLLKTSCEPYTRSVTAENVPVMCPFSPAGAKCVCFFFLNRFMSDWVYSGVFRDVYGEFMIQVNEEYLGFRGEESQTPSLSTCCVSHSLWMMTSGAEYLCREWSHLCTVSQRNIFWRTELNSIFLFFFLI